MRFHQKSMNISLILTENILFFSVLRLSRDFIEKLAIIYLLDVFFLFIFNWYFYKSL